MGLHRLEEAGGASPIETKPVLQALLASLDWVKDVGDLGVLLWMCALMAPERLSELEGRIDLQTALLRYPSAKRGVTMELAWFLTGLSNWALACPDKQPRLNDLAFQTFALLKKNRGEQGFFRPSGSRWKRHRHGARSSRKLCRSGLSDLRDDQIFPGLSSRKRIADGSAMRTRPV